MAIADARPDWLIHLAAIHFIPDCMARPLEPIDVYGESKLAAERLVGGFHEETGVPVSTLRLFNAIGPNETNPHVVPDIVGALRSSDTIRLGNITPERDYIDTRDVADAVMAVAAGATGAGVFNVGTGVAHSVKDILDLLGRLLGRTITAVPDPGRMRAVERIRLVANIDRIRRMTGWAPQISRIETTTFSPVAR